MPEDGTKLDWPPIHLRPTSTAPSWYVLELSCSALSSQRRALCMSVGWPACFGIVSVVTGSLVSWLAETSVDSSNRYCLPAEPRLLMKPSGAMQVELWEHYLQARAKQVACSKEHLL